jgi:cytochrome c oxidase subunit 2
VSLPASQLLAETNFGSPQGVTTQDAHVRHLWHMTYFVGIPLGLIVLGLIVWCVVRYRARPGHDREPSQFQYHIPLEAAYTLIPLIIVIVVFVVMYRAENAEDAVSAKPAVTIQVQGFQWGWRFTYPNGFQEAGATSATNTNLNTLDNLPVLRMPADETVQFDLTTADVDHTLYIPAFLFSRDMIAGVKNTVDFNATRIGVYTGECTQLCGVYHTYMRFVVQVMSPTDYDAWYAQTVPGAVHQPGKFSP